MKQSLLSCVLCLFCLCTCVTGAWAKNLETLNVDSLNALLAKNSGKVVMLNFFATWCPPCRAEIPDLVSASKLYAGKNVIFLGLSVDDAKSKATVEKFLTQLQVPYPVYMAGPDLLKKYSIGSIPHNVFYDRSGNMIISQPGECDIEDIKLVVEELLHDN